MTCGVISVPDTIIVTMSTAIDPVGPTSAIAATSTANPPSSAGIRRCSGRGQGRIP